jgi:hypothetical protein
MFMIVAITNKAKKVCELSLLFVLFMWTFFYRLFFFFLSNIHMNSALFRHFHMNSEICFPFFAILFFFFFLHYLHEESFSFLHCFYYCVTIHMNSEPFFTIHIIFFLLLQLMSLFKWIVHLFSIFFHYSHDQCNFQNCLHGDIFFLFFFLQLFCTIHTNNLFFLKNFNTIHIVELIHQIMTWRAACILRKN